MFRASRLADFATEDELIKQTGQPVENWPLVVLKELADNALDDAEKTGVAPEIEIVVTENSITVADHGSGIAPATVKTLVDYSFRMSSKAAYVSPTRGRQGAALQSVLAMPFVLDGKAGEVLIESRSVAHRISFTVDPVRQRPNVSRAKERSAVKNGTRAPVCWPEQARSLIADAKGRFLSLASTYILLNPHLTLSTEWRADAKPVRLDWRATDSGWTKWRPNQPTSAHWYHGERLKLLMAAEIAYAEDHRAAFTSVRDFIGQFRGLSGTAKARDICAELGVGERLSLAAFYQQHDSAAAMLLLTAMQARSQPVKPRDLGVIGREHLMARFAEQGVDETDGRLPLGRNSARRSALRDRSRVWVPGRSWSRRRHRPARRRGLQLQPGRRRIAVQPRRALAHADIESDDAVTVFAHLTSPRLNFLDKGASAVDFRSVSRPFAPARRPAPPECGR